MRIVPRVITAVVGLFMLALGIWAMVDARSFYETIATYPPFNPHLFHDVGAFQAGIGFTLLYALLRRDALRVALWGASVGTALHALSHWIDRDLGGKSTDAPLLTALSAAVIIATAIYSSQRER